MLPKNLEIQIKNWSLEGADQEKCGLLVKTPTGICCFHSKNTSPKKHTHFVVCPFDYVRASEIGQVIGCYHSHIGESDNFSEFDKNNAEKHKLIYVLYVNKQDKFKYYTPQNKKDDFLCREFVIGKNDCLSLVRDYFQQKLNIQIKDFERKNDWFDKNPRIVFENFGSQQFINIFSDDFDWNGLKKHDILAWGESFEKLYHFMIFLGENTILHHPRNKFSIMEQLRPSMKNQVKAIFRHKSLIFV